MTEKRTVVSSSKQAQQLKELIARGKEQGYLTYAEVNDHLPNDIVDPEQIEEIVNMINDMGIAVHEKAPEVDSITLSETAVSNDDEDAAVEAEAALASVDAEFGRTTDPVRMYMRDSKMYSIFCVSASMSRRGVSWSSSCPPPLPCEFYIRAGLVMRY